MFKFIDAVAKRAGWIFSLNAIALFSFLYFGWSLPWWALVLVGLGMCVPSILLSFLLIVMAIGRVQ